MRRNAHAFTLVSLLAIVAACRDSNAPTAPEIAAPAQSRSSHDRDDRPGVGLRLVAEGFTQPVVLVHTDDGSGRLFVADQIGLIRIIDRDGTLRSEPFLDIRAKLVTLNPGYDERGLLGLAFHPQFRRNGRFFVYYSRPRRPGAPAGFNHTSRIAEFHVSSDPNRADLMSERMILEIDKPQSNHNGGTIAFGPNDGFLYISIGDGGGANDVGLGHVPSWYTKAAGYPNGNEFSNAQSLTDNLLGKILRIDVDRGSPYAIPGDNPFVRRGGLPEIYAFGLRNPWRFSFDRDEDHALIAGDAGQERWEEVDVIRKGGNYGWNVKEGRHCFNASMPTVDAPSCPDAMPPSRVLPDGTPLIDPVIEYPNEKQGGLGLVVVGGVVYRGEKIDQLEGRYLFGDWSKRGAAPAGQLFVATPQGSGTWPMQKLFIATSPDGELHHRLLAFGEDRRGEVYVLTTDNSGPRGTTGKVFVLIDTARGETPDDEADR
jgi:glucose/arabinose dehydrogenase